MSKIKLKRDLGPVVFLGGVNAMPMMYALELKEMGVDVLYFVDRPKSDTLSRPENHFSDIHYPYPNWVVEFGLLSQILLPLFPLIFSYIFLFRIFLYNKKRPQAFILNGFFCSLSPYFLKGIPKIFLSSGSDLDSWADVDMSENLGNSFSDRSIFKFMPKFVSKYLINIVVRKQFNGAANCQKVLYFPRGFNAAGDRVLDQLEMSGVDFLERYDISFHPLKMEARGVVRNSKKLVIFSGVRFLFKTFPDGNDGYGKGNDLIIEALSIYRKINSNIEIHFVEKGEDVASAKEMCIQFGLNDVVIWHKEMKFLDLLALYRVADICFDQVGKHWIGAVGFYALWLGIPLIANDKQVRALNFWKTNSPIHSASTVNEIVSHLVHLSDFNARCVASERSMFFSDAELGPAKVVSRLFEF